MFAVADLNYFKDFGFIALHDLQLRLEGEAVTDILSEGVSEYHILNDGYE